MGRKVVLAGACRTAIGTMGGALSKIPAPDLATIVVKESLKRAGVKPEQVDEVYMGCVIAKADFVEKNKAAVDTFLEEYRTSIEATSSDVKTVAELCEKYVKAIGQNSRGVKSGNHLYFIKKTKMTSVLCECAFIDNDKDNDIIDTTSEQKAFGLTYAKAILEYFGIYSNTVQKPVFTPTKTETKDFKVEVPIPNLNIRKGPGTNYDRIGEFTGKGVFTIVETSSGKGSDTGWGKLKSGKGWISLDFAKKI